MVVNIGNAGRVTENVTQRVVMIKDNEKPLRLEQVCARACVCVWRGLGWGAACAHVGGRDENKE